MVSCQLSVVRRKRQLATDDRQRTTHMLTLNNIEVMYNDVVLVLKGLSLQVEQGQIVALLGSNGAGKSTTLKAISGLLKPENGALTDGEILFLGQPLAKHDAAAVVRAG